MPYVLTLAKNIMHKIELKKVIKQSEKMERQHFMVEMRTFHQLFSVNKMLLHLYLLIPCLKHISSTLIFILFYFVYLLYFYM